MIAVSLVACMAAAATVNGLPVEILPAVQAIEGGRDGLVRHNRNGSRDLGLMQINTLWLQPLSRATGLPGREVRRKLLDDGCFNIAAAGAILRIYREKTAGDLWRAVGNYHSHSTFLSVSYQARVLHTVRLLAKAERLEARRVAFDNRLIVDAARDVRLQDADAAAVASLRTRAARENAELAFADRHDDRDEPSARDRYDLDQRLARHAGGEMWSTDPDSTGCPDNRPHTDAGMGLESTGSVRHVRLVGHDRHLATERHANHGHSRRVRAHSHNSHRISSHERADHRRRV